MEEQMSKLMEILELTQEDYDERAKIAKYIQVKINLFSNQAKMNSFFQFQSAICELYPSCIVYLFGSTVNGLGFKGCDIDAFMDLGKLLFHRFLICGYCLSTSITFLRPLIIAQTYAL